VLTRSKMVLVLIVESLALGVTTSKVTEAVDLRATDRSLSMKKAPSVIEGAWEDKTSCL